ncbi:MAG TPA: hypothetical protein VE619_10525, partial [Nitrososphaeraceae archaeon]|nr:hypothetical protein [Nitrososphaeraceae archaeon]
MQVADQRKIFFPPNLDIYYAFYHQIADRIFELLYSKKEKGYGIAKFSVLACEILRMLIHTRYKFTIFLISNPVMKKIYELNDLLSELEERKGYFIDFVA